RQCITGARSSSSPTTPSDDSSRLARGSWSRELERLLARERALRSAIAAAVVHVARLVLEVVVALAERRVDARDRDGESGRRGRDLELERGGRGLHRQNAAAHARILLPDHELAGAGLAVRLDCDAITAG